MPLPGVALALVRARVFGAELMTRDRVRPASTHDEVKPSHGPTLPIQHELMDARPLEADVTPRSFQRLASSCPGPARTVREADALQLIAGRIDERHGQLVVASRQNDLRQRLKRRRAPLETNQYVLHEKAAVGVRTTRVVNTWLLTSKLLWARATPD